MDDSTGETLARCQTLFEECPEAVAIVTHEAQVLDVNQDWLELIASTRTTCGIAMTPLPVFVVGRRSWRPRSLHSSWTLPKFPCSSISGSHRETMAVWRNWSRKDGVRS
jgi:hypothetical protein